MKKTTKHEIISSKFVTAVTGGGMDCRRLAVIEHGFLALLVPHLQTPSRTTCRLEDKFSWLFHLSLVILNPPGWTLHHLRTGQGIIRRRRLGRVGELTKALLSKFT